MTTLDRIDLNAFNASNQSNSGMIHYPTINYQNYSSIDLSNLRLDNINLNNIPSREANNIPDLSNLRLDNINLNNLPNSQLSNSLDLINLPDLNQLKINERLTTFEAAYILASKRKQCITSKLNSSELVKMAGKITIDERDNLMHLREWVKYLQTIKTNFFPEHSNGSLITHLGIKTKHTFPIPGKFATKQEYVLAYYLSLGFDIWPKPKNFNPEQQFLLSPTLSGIYVINAGPGTGKTTVANERAYYMMKEGVLLVSYTNEAINENYNRLKSYPMMRGSLMKKKFTKEVDVINICTVDSLANHLVGGNSDNYDMTVLQATTKCSNLNGKTKRYKHIIVDEAQDIDDLRGNLIMTYFLTSGAKSICIFGDPRQRIHEKNGAWYTKLWVDGYFYQHPIYRIGFTYTYRFENRLHVEIANKLSKQRPEIDHPLQIHESVPYYSNEIITLYSAQTDILDNNLGMIADYIQFELCQKQKVKYADIAIIGPSTNKDNATSDLAGKICAVFKDRDIPCYQKMNGGFIPNAVYFGTIHSVKGKEFDHVFMFGCDSFPETFDIIPYDSAQSLIYVMHTRARKRMYYINPKQKMFTPPRGLRPLPINDENKKDEKLYISHPENLRNEPYEREVNGDIFYPISDLAKEFSLDRLLESNEFDIRAEFWFKYDHEIPQRPEEINERFWGILCSFIVQLWMIKKYHDIFSLFLANKYKTISDSEYIQKTRKGSIVNGFEIATGSLMIKKGLVNSLREEEMNSLRAILSKPIDDLIISEYVFLAKVYDFLVSGHTQSRYDIDSYTNDKLLMGLKELAKNIQETFGQCLEVEKMVTSPYMSIIGAVDALHGDHVLEFKTSQRELERMDALQVQLYHCCTGKTPILINLQTGKVYQAISDETLTRWRYMMKSYTALRTHVDEVITRKNKLIERGKYNPQIEIDKQAFTVDTEFAIMNKWFKGKPQVEEFIFDIAIINLFDPYRSIIQSVNPGKAEAIHQATNWLNEVPALFVESKSINDIKAMFLRLCHMLGFRHETAQLINYVCPVDVNWFREGRPSLDLAGRIKEDAKELGYITLGKAPQLSEYYAIKCQPTETQPHLKIHTAMADSLLLYELIHLQKIPNHTP